MEIWQREHIRKNLPSLVEQIRCNAQVFSHLQKHGMLSAADIEELKATYRIYGDLEQTRVLLSILETRISGYKWLAQTLFYATQSGALLLLLQGVPENVTNNPWKYCDIRLSYNDIKTKCVLFGGRELLFEDLMGASNNDVSSRNVLFNRLTSNPSYLHVLADPKSTIDVSKNTIPSPSFKYIPRNLEVNNRLLPSFFEDFNSDIFLIAGIPKSELSELAKNCMQLKDNMLIQLMTGTKGHTSVSSRHLVKVTSRFILLETWTHFQKISSICLEPVHWIEYRNGAYIFIRTDGKRKLKDIEIYFYQDEVIQVSDEDLVKGLSRNKETYPFIICDKPGMGKSCLLHNVARRLREADLGCSGQHAYQPKSVILIEMTELLKLFRKTNFCVNITSIYNIIMDYVTEDKLGKTILSELFKLPQHVIYLFVDGVDEVSFMDIGIATEIISIISRSSMRAFIACRPYIGSRLSHMLNVRLYSIASLDQVDQVSLITNHWMMQYNIEITGQVINFSKQCISKIKSFSENTVAGIPLQCQMLADVYAQSILNGVFEASEDAAWLSVYQLYKAYVNNKLNFRNAMFSRSEALSLHRKLAINEIFPGYIMDSEYTEHLDTFSKVGIVEAALPARLKFIHKTYAEYLIAELALDALQSGKGQLLSYDKLLELILCNVLSPENHNFLVECENKKYPLFMYQKFKNSTIAYFINSGMSDRQFLFNIKCMRENFFKRTYQLGYSTNSFLNCCLVSNAENLLKFALSTVYAGKNYTNFETVNDIWCQVMTNISTFSQGDGDDRFLWMCAKELVFPETILSAAYFSSYELVKLVTLLVSNVKNCNLLGVEVCGYLTPLHLAMKRGNYEIVEYFLRIYESTVTTTHFLLHECLFQSQDDSPSVLKNKTDIVRYLRKEYPDMLEKIDNLTGVPPLLTNMCHWTLLRQLILAGANVLVTANQKTIAHLVARYFSKEQFHSFVELLISKELIHILKLCDGEGCTAVHIAAFHMDLELETLLLLQTHCRITFNEKTIEGITPLGYAARGRASTQTILNMISLGAKLYETNTHLSNHDVLCFLAMRDSLDTLKEVIKVANREEKPFHWFAHNVWQHAFECRKGIQMDIISCLIQNKILLNSVLADKTGSGLTLFRTLLSWAKVNVQDEHIICMLEAAGIKEHTVYSILHSIAHWVLFFILVGTFTFSFSRLQNICFAPTICTYLLSILVVSVYTIPHWNGLRKANSTFPLLWSNTIALMFDIVYLLYLVQQTDTLSIIEIPFVLIAFLAKLFYYFKMDDFLDLMIT